MELYCYRGPATVFWDPLVRRRAAIQALFARVPGAASVAAFSAYQEETRYEQMPNLKEMKTKPEKETIKTPTAVKLRDLKPRKDAQAKGGTSKSYSGSHALYQDIVIPT